jgi:hypothetical protein
MSMRKNAWFSTVDLRPDPKDPGGAVSLGYLLEFTTEDYWVIGMIMRATVDDSRIAAFDQLTKKILDDRVHVMKAEINQILPRAKKPGEALALLASVNPWSLYVSSPSRLVLPDQRSVRGASVEKLLEKFVYSLFFADRVPKRRRRPALTPTSTHSIPERRSDEIPPAWMLPPTYVMLPLVHG